MARTLNVSSKSIDVLEENIIYKGFFEFREVKLKHSLYQGGRSTVLSREIFNRNEAVVVLLYDLKNQKVILVEQFRAGAMRNALASQQAENAWLIEPVAGMIDTGETAKAAGIRETEEEAGVQINNLEFIAKYYPSPGACDEILHLYAAEIDSSELQSHSGKADEHEDIKVIVMPFAEAKQKLMQAEFNVASTFLALQWLFFQKLPG